MKSITRLIRLAKINYVLVRYNLNEMILTTQWLYPLRFLSYLNPFYWTLKNKYTRGERLRLALEELGPIFIKAGQILSTRRDLLPDDIAEELAKLQDQVPPFSGLLAKQMIESELGQPLSQVFQDFDLIALASASIAQVHAATLLDGRSAVVKVLRPNIRGIIDNDIDLLMTLASLAERHWPKSRGFKPKELVTEIAQTLHDELDLMREGANASQLRRNFQHSSHLLYTPEIYWLYSRPTMLVMERIYGIPINQIDALKAANINLKKLAERCIEVFFTQVFRDSFFHADMHPGNIFVSADHPEDPQLIAVDFGMAGSLSSRDQRYLAENLLAFFKKDYQRVAELHIESGWLPPDTRIDQFEGAIRAVCEPIFERPLREVSFGQLLLRLFQTARRFHINIQPQLILLQKTLLSIEGLSRQVYPDLDLWGEAAPHLKKWMKQQVGPRSFFRRIRDNLPYWSEKLPEIPGLIYEVLKQTHQQNEEAYFAKQRAAKKTLRLQKKSMRRYFLLGVGSSLMATGLGLFFQSLTPMIIPAVLLGIGLVALVSAVI